MIHQHNPGLCANKPVFIGAALAQKSLRQQRRQAHYVVVGASRANDNKLVGLPRALARLLPEKKERGLCALRLCLLAHNQKET
jgi:hypothetical protein